VVGAWPYRIGMENSSHRGSFQFDEGPRGTASATEFVISSGSLYNLTVLQVIGGFREDFSSTRSTLSGASRSIVGLYLLDRQCRANASPARQGIIRVPLINMHLARQCIRLYTYVRTRRPCCACRHVPRRWKLRILPYMLGQSVVYTVGLARKRRQVVRALGQDTLMDFASDSGRGDGFLQ